MSADRQTSGIRWTWSRTADSVHIRFLGRSAPRSAEGLLEALDPRPRGVSWLRQVHSNRVLDAHPGETGEGDALVTSHTDLALAIATADCVPVLLATPQQVAAAHAGWRGLVGDVISEALSRLTAPVNLVRAWIGPAIGACCYEIGEDVAAPLRAVGGPDTVRSRPGGKSHADLQAIAEVQLRARGVETIERTDLCTRCHPELLWSYRRQGESAGRNWSVIWRSSTS